MFCRSRLLAILIICFVLSGTAFAVGASGGKGQSRPAYGGTLHLPRFDASTPILNPVTPDGSADDELISMIHAGLIRFDEADRPQALLAESWEWNQSATRLSFRLRPGIRFQDGTPVTADDVVFTFKAMMHPCYGGRFASGWDAIKGYQDYHSGLTGETTADFAAGIVTPAGSEGLYAPDSQTVVFELNRPDVTLPVQAARGLVDHRQYAGVPVQLWGTDQDPNAAAPNGAGPFQWRGPVEEGYLLAANPLYYRGRPYVDQIIVSVHGGHLLEEMSAGLIDYTPIGAWEVGQFSALPGVQVRERPSGVIQELIYNTTRFPMDDLRVRQAFSYDIDREAIIALPDLMNGHATPQYTPVPAGSWAYSDNVSQYRRNLERARELLDQAGWVPGDDGIRVKEGRRLSARLSYPSVGNMIRQRTAPYVQGWLAAIGAEVVLEPHPDPRWAYGREATAPGAYSVSGWWTERSEAMLAEAVVATNLMHRAAIYRRWQRYWAEENPALVLYNTNSIFAVNTRVQTLKIDRNGGIANIEEIWLAR